MSTGTLMVGILVLLILALALRSIVRARKSGCGGACAGCASQKTCQSAARQE